VKEVDSTQIDTINPLLLVPGQGVTTQQTLYNLRQLYESVEGPTTLHKGRLIPRDEHANVQFFQTRAGAIVCDKVTGDRIYNHEYDHISWDNLIGATCTRQLATMV